MDGSNEGKKDSTVLGVSSSSSSLTKSVQFPLWKVWRAAKELDYGGSSSLLSLRHDAQVTCNNEKGEKYYGTIAHEAATVLLEWGQKWAGNPKFQSLLNKPTLLHEIEESIVAIQSLMEWLTNYSDMSKVETSSSKNYPQNKIMKMKHEEENAASVINSQLHLTSSCIRNIENNKDITIVDFCCGKGVFSMLLSYLAGRPTLIGNALRALKRCIMINKAKPDQIDWDHIDWTNKEVAIYADSCNRTGTTTARIPIEVWGGCNVHDESFLQKIQSIPGTLAIVGIHLCKTLGPRCVSIFNSLGNEKAPFLCLAPCCLPRLTRNEKNGIIPVTLYESKSDQTKRLHFMKLRDQALRRSKNGTCFICHKVGHRARQCSLLLAHDENKRAKLLQSAAATAPCWRCGIVGHQKVNCVSKQTSSRPNFIGPPTFEMNVSRVQSTLDPFGTYCHLLANSVQTQGLDTIKVLDTPLVNSSTHHQEGNWNSSRKSKFIIVARQP